MLLCVFCIVQLLCYCLFCVVEGFSRFSMVYLRGFGDFRHFLNDCRKVFCKVVFFLFLLLMCSRFVQRFSVRRSGFLMVFVCLWGKTCLIIGRCVDRKKHHA